MAEQKELYLLSGAQITDEDSLLNQIIQSMFKMGHLTLPLYIFSNKDRLLEYASDFNNLIESHYKFVLTYTGSKNKPKKIGTDDIKVKFMELLSADDCEVCINNNRFKGLPAQHPLKISTGVVDLYLIIKSMSFTLIDGNISSSIMFDVLLYGPPSHINHMQVAKQQFRVI